MLNAILAAALKNRALVLVLALGIGVFGLFRAAKTPIDVLPDLDRPLVTVLTEAHGMVPESVERLITWPIEQVVNGATDVFRVRSSSGMGLSVVWVEFDWDTPILHARQIVAEKLQIATAQLPPGVQPVLAPISSIMGQVQLVGFQSTDGTTGPAELRLRVERDVRPRLLSLNGVAQIVVMGGQPTELQVVVNADALRAFEVTLQEVAEAVQRANVSVTGSTLAMGAKGPLVAVSGMLESPDQLARAVVRADPVRPVRIADVAEVRFDATTLRTGDADIDGVPGVLLVINKQPGADTLSLSREVQRELDRIAVELPPDVRVLPELFQQAAFIERAVDNVLLAVRDGALLVVLVLFLFLWNVRTTFITLAAIPLSIAVAALVFSAFGLTLNTMTLGGLAVAIGSLVDDAIVDVENVYRRLHENARRSDPRPVLWVLFKASSEIRRPVLYGTLLVTVVYVPLFFLSGIEGRLFAPIGLAYIVSVAASLGVALTVTPVLCYYLLGRSPRRDTEYGGRVVRALHRVATSAVRFSARSTATILGASVSMAVLVVLLLSRSGTAFLPAFNEGSAQVNLILPPDTSLETSNRFGQRLAKLVKGVEGVRSVARRTGRAEGDEHAMPVSVTEAIVTFDPDSKRSREDILEDIRARIGEEFPGVATETEQPLAHLLSHLLSGVTAQVAIKVMGPDLDLLRELAKDVESRVRDIEGVRDLYTEPQVLIDQVEVLPDRDQLGRYGLSVDDVAHTVELAMGGEEVSRFQVGSMAYPIRVRLREQDRRDLEQIRTLSLRRDQGDRTRLGDVALVRVSKTPSGILRENGQRRIVVQHNVGGRSLGEVVADVDRALEPVRERLAGMPGTSLRIQGQFEAQQQATRRILGLSVITLFVMVGILYAHFRSIRLAMLVLTTRPLALVGGAVAVLVTGQTLSVATLVGFIALLGMAARNSILLVDHLLHRMREDGEPFSLELIVHTAQERIVPVLMTALTSGIGLLPLALAADQPGRELLYPVATVILGGLFTNTLLDFLVMPGLLHWFFRKEAERVTELPIDEDSMERAARTLLAPSERRFATSVTAAPLETTQGGLGR